MGLKEENNKWREKTKNRDWMRTLEGKKWKNIHLNSLFLTFMTKTFSRNNNWLKTFFLK